MAVEDIEKRVRSITEKDLDSGKEMAAFQEAQNELIRINAERQNNIAMARAGANTDSEVNNTLLQASELSAMNSQGVQQQVETMNPQTQAVLGKYGLGKPKTQRTSSRDVKVTPNNITINNNTTNNTTNNVAVPPSNIGGPVQSRTLAVKSDQSQANFKTWISNAFARQNQQAAMREKEYQRREWSLSRSTGKLMKRLESLGTTISERLDPRRMASTVGGHLKTLLFLFGTKFLASNWDKVIKIGASIERFFLGEVVSRNEDGSVVTRGVPGYKKYFRDLFSGENGLGKWLVKSFGGKEGESLGAAFSKLFWNGDSEKTGKDAGIFNIFLKKIKDWFEEGVQAANSIEMPKNLLSKEPIEALESLIKYFSTVISSLFTGGKTLKKSIDASIEKKGSEAIRSNEIGGRYRKNNEKRYHEILEPEELERLGVTDQNIITSGVNRGDLAEGNEFSTHLFSNDLTKDNKLTGTIGSVIRQVNNIGILTRDSDKMNLTGFTMGMRNLDEYMKEDSKKGDKATGLVLGSTSSWQKLGVNPELVSELRRSGNVKSKRFVYVLDEKTPEEKREELKHATSAEKEAAKEYANQFIKNKIGARKTVWKIIGGAAGLAGGLILAPVTGGASLLLSAASLTAAGITGAWLGSKISGGAHDIIMDEKLQSALKWAITHDEIKLVKPYTIRLVPKDEVGNRPIIKDKGELTKEVLDYEGWKRIKESQGMLIRDSSGKVISERDYNLRDNYWRENSKNIYSNIAEQQGIDLNDIPTKTDIDEVNWDAESELDKLREIHRKEQEELYSNSRFNRGVDSIKDSINDAANNITTSKPLAKNKKDFIEKVKPAYEKVLKEKGIDTKYSDVLVAQSALESGWGKSVSGNNNLGGIKVDRKDKGKGLGKVVKTTEYINGEYVPIYDEFKNFDSVEDYARYHIDFVNRNRYKAFSGDSIEDYINNVVRGGYATDPDYKEKLFNTVSLVQRYNINEKDTNSNSNEDKTIDGGVVDKDNEVFLADADSSIPLNPKENSNFVLPEPDWKNNYSINTFNDSNFSALSPNKFISLDSSKPVVNSSSNPTISSPITEIASNIVEDNNSSTNMESISDKIVKVNDNLRLIQQGQLAQAEAIGNLARGIGNMTINVNSTPSSNPSVPGFTGAPFNS